MNPILLSFAQACKRGDVEEFNKIFSSLSVEQKNEFIEFDHYACFHNAVANGHHNIVEFIFNYVKSVTDEAPVDEAVIPIFSERNGEGFKAALANLHIETVALILHEEFLHEKCLDIIAENPEFIKNIWDSPLKIYIFIIFDKYCGINISVVQYILKVISKLSQSLLIEGFSSDSEQWRRYDEANQFIELSLCPFRTACYSGKLDIVQFLWNLFTSSQQTKMVETQFSDCCIAAAKNGYFDIIKQLTAWTQPEQRILFLTAKDFSAFIYAADRGHVEIVQLIWESLPASLQSEALSASNFAAYRLATKEQHSRVIDFFESNTSKETIEKMQNAVSKWMRGLLREKRSQ